MCTLALCWCLATLAKNGFCPPSLGELMRNVLAGHPHVCNSVLGPSIIPRASQLPTERLRRRTRFRFYGWPSMTYLSPFLPLHHFSLGPTASGCCDGWWLMLISEHLLVYPIVSHPSELGYSVSYECSMTWYFMHVSVLLCALQVPVVCQHMHPSGGSLCVCV